MVYYNINAQYPNLSFLFLYNIKCNKNMSIYIYYDYEINLKEYL